MAVRPSDAEVIEKWSRDWRHDDQISRETWEHSNNTFLRVCLVGKDRPAVRISLCGDIWHATWQHSTIETQLLNFGGCRTYAFALKYTANYLDAVAVDTSSREIVTI
jgi:hypothetical protein